MVLWSPHRRDANAGKYLIGQACLLSRSMGATRALQTRELAKRLYLLTRSQVIHAGVGEMPLFGELVLFVQPGFRHLSR
jgi:hypothetical protein